jgi:hypothetical protein
LTTGLAPKSIAPATALAPIAPVARRRAEESVIVILGAPFIGDTTNAKMRFLAKAKIFRQYGLNRIDCIVQLFTLLPIGRPGVYLGSSPY